VKWYQAVRVVEEVQTLRERATALRCSLFPTLFHALSKSQFAHISNLRELKYS